MSHEEAAIAVLVAAYEGDTTQALLALARHAGIAVHYQNRVCLEGRFGRDFTEAEWERVKPYLEGYDEWIENSGAHESTLYFAAAVLPKWAGVEACLHTEEEVGEDNLFYCKACGEWLGR